MNWILRFLLAAVLTLPLNSAVFAQEHDEGPARAELEQLEDQLDDLRRQVRRLHDRAEELNDDRLDDEMRVLRRHIRRTERALRRVASQLEARYDDDQLDAWQEEVDDAMEEMREALNEARDDLQEALGELDDAFDEDDWADEDEWEDDWDEDESDWEWEWEWGGDDDRHEDWPPEAFERHSDLSTFVGDFSYRWPYAQTALYRPIPSIRYNRTEGFVLGAGLRPLEWGEYRRSKLFGQVGYAFALDEWRYDVGVETRLHDGDYATKVGVLYRRNTVTEDLWKSNWAENSLAAFFFNNDFFDYYEVEGWSFYGVQRLTRRAQLSVGFRTEKHRALDVNTGWALFGKGEDFALNPAAQRGRNLAVVLALEGGRVASLRYLPQGYAYRFEAELADGLGGDFAFNRYVADVRGYVRATSYSSLSARVRGGLATGEVPLQKEFTLGGLGSIRGYPQNTFFGTRMLLVNAEYAIEDVDLLPDLLDDVLFFGFFDAGWTNQEGDAFDVDEVYPSAGIGLGFDDRALRLELAFPLRDGPYNDQDPSLWLRLNPSF